MGVVNIPCALWVGYFYADTIVHFVSKSAKAINENEDLSKELYNEKRILRRT